MKAICEFCERIFVFESWETVSRPANKWLGICCPECGEENALRLRANEETQDDWPETIED